MLRALVVVLILANLAFVGWRQGWLDALALGEFHPGVSQRDPERLKQQVHPERLIVMPPPADTSASAALEGPTSPASGAVSSASPAGPASAGSQPLATQVSASGVGAAAGACYQAGPLTADEHRRVNAALVQQLPSGSWTTQTVAAPGLWLLYMGPYQDSDMLARKQTELKRIRNLNFEEVRSPPSLAMGLSLGRFNLEAQAEASLENLRLRGVRTARVVTIRPAAELIVIRVPQASPEVQSRLPALPLPAGKSFTACST